MRSDGRAAGELRPARCETDVNVYAEGSCLFSLGYTRVLCTASLGYELPRWRRDSGLGWITAEYRLLPRATATRSPREGRLDIRGRTAEIQRMIGRALRAVVDLEALGHRLITVDCDVLQADGGTRTASIDGGFVALVLALRRLVESGELPVLPLRHRLSAVSVGLVDGEALLDLSYEEDARAELDLNVVGAGPGLLVEIQGAAETGPFPRSALEPLLELAEHGLEAVARVQDEALRAHFSGGLPWEG